MAAKITFDADRCKGCGLCAAVCPKHIDRKSTRLNSSH